MKVPAIMRGLLMFDVLMWILGRRPQFAGRRPQKNTAQIFLLVVNATEMFLSFCYTLHVLDESRELRIAHSIYMYEI